MLLICFVAVPMLVVLGSESLSEEKHIDANGVQIRFTDEGNGQAVILIHGFAANAELNWRLPGITAALAEQYRVIALDVRGHGRSAKPHETNAYGLEMVNDVIRVMDHLEVDKAHLVGYSMGGFITMKLMTHHPDRVISATLGGSGGIRDDFDHGWDKAMAEKLDGGASFVDALVTTLPKDLSLQDSQIAMMKAMFGNQDNKALTAVLRSWHELTVSNASLKNNQIPTLFIYGSDEDETTRAYIEALKDQMANAEFRMIEGTDHLTTAASSEFRESLLKFLAANSGN